MKIKIEIDTGRELFEGDEGPYVAKILQGVVLELAANECLKPTARNLLNADGRLVGTMDINKQ